MTYQVKKSIVSLISDILAFTIYYLYVMQLYNAGNYSGDEEFKFWASVILILLPVLIVFKIVVLIFFTIVETIITREKLPSITDELDNLIDLKSTRNFSWVFSAGFFLSMGALVMGMSPTFMFNMLLFSIILAGLMLDISQLYFYRKGI
jgi:hypothetical protein